jgi:hypothetical protein
MFLRSFVTTLYQTVVLTVLFALSLSLTSGEVRTSNSYQLQSDSINFGGGLSTSTNYSMESTAGEVATGDSDSATYSLRAGYQQMQEVFISITAASNVTMSPSLGGITGGESNGSTTVIVTTDSPAGYDLTIETENSPAMQSDLYSIADYVPDTAPADFVFSTAGNEAHFGFSPEGADVVATYRDNNSACGVGGLDTSLRCWDGLSTTAFSIASGAANHPSGATTTIHFKVGIGANAPVVAGTYVATTTLTAIPL